MYPWLEDTLANRFGTLLRSARLPLTALRYEVIDMYIYKIGWYRVITLVPLWDGGFFYVYYKGDEVDETTNFCPSKTNVFTFF